jgi:ElaA protein
MLGGWGKPHHEVHAAGAEVQRRCRDVKQDFVADGERAGESRVRDDLSLDLLARNLRAAPDRLAVRPLDSGDDGDSCIQAGHGAILPRSRILLLMVMWRCLPFPALTTSELYKILAARSEVFVVEQDCVYQDPDDHDQSAFHLWGQSDGQQLAAYLRILPPGEKYPEASLGRVLTRAAWRGTGLGKVLVAEGIAHSWQLFPHIPLRISAQAHLETFYGAFGFLAISPPYDEDGIPHIEMLLATESVPAIRKLT